MKRIFFGAIVVVLTSGMCVLAGAQSENSSLGDYARSIKKNKPQESKAAAKVYDNDNLPTTPSISVVGASSAAGESSNQNQSAPGSVSSSDARSAGAENTPQIKPGESVEDRKKAISAWKDKIDAQKQKVEQLAHELDEYQHSNSKTYLPVWPYNRDYQVGLEEKQKALEQARSELSAMQEQAHKAGAPNSAIE